MVAAGSGQRFGGDTPKQFLQLGGKPVVLHALSPFLDLKATGQITDIIVVVPEKHLKQTQSLMEQATPQTNSKVITCITGGKDRRDSVLNALKHLQSLQKPPDFVLIHDAARPLTPKAVFERVIQALQSGAIAAIPTLAVADTLRRWDDKGNTNTVPRDKLFQVQTPQGFDFTALFTAHTHAATQGETVTDDAALLEQSGISIIGVAGDFKAMKLTHPEDLALLETFLDTQTSRHRHTGVGQYPVTTAGMDSGIRQSDDCGKDSAYTPTVAPNEHITKKPTPRVGMGFDVHAFGKAGDKDHIILCGVKIPHTSGMVGHSDADVALHALTDALLGALALGDIGQHFPPSDPQWKGANSSIFLKFALEKLWAEGGNLHNIDLTIIAESPKLSPHREAMLDSLSALTHLPKTAIGLKATTTEKLGFTGRGEGIAVQAVVMLEI